MDEVMQEIGGDGFLISLGDVNRRSVAEIMDESVSALQHRGLTRTGYRQTISSGKMWKF